MRKYISWDEITSAAGVYYQLAVDTNCVDTNCVIFTMGSMVKVTAEEMENESNYFCGYTPEVMETWPMWRIASTENQPTPSEIYKDLVTVWTLQSHCEDEEISKVIKCAYKKLLSDGVIADDIVPIVCGTGDSCLLDFNGGTNIVFDDSIIAELSDEKLAEYVDTAISLREYDLMFPQVYAVISTKLELIIFVDE
jgi:hypothetical protein